MTKTCSATDCDRQHFGKGLCQRHLERKRRNDRKAAQAPRCSIQGCDGAVVSRGWCEGHYRRWLDHSDPLAGRLSPVGGRCSIDGCERPNAARTWCALHYQRWLKTGDVGPADVQLPATKLPGHQSRFWRGHQLTYSGAHSRVRTIRGPASLYPCTDCSRPAAHWSYNHTDPAELIAGPEEDCRPYSTNPGHYRPRCNSCHVIFDNRTRGLVRR